jgi:hypothetical protein
MVEFDIVLKVSSTKMAVAKMCKNEPIAPSITNHSNSISNRLKPKKLSPRFPQRHALNLTLENCILIEVRGWGMPLTLGVVDVVLVVRRR